MPIPSLDDDEEKPLDPAIERVRARLSRLFLIAGLTLGLGIFAVFAAILYKIATGDKPPMTAWQPGQPIPVIALAGMGLQPGAELVSTTVDGRRLVLTYAQPDGRTALVFVDVQTLEVTGRLDVVAE